MAKLNFKLVMGLLESGWHDTQLEIQIPYELLGVSQSAALP